MRLLFALALLMPSPGVRRQELATSLPNYLARQGCSAEEISVVEGGSPLVKLLPGDEDTETHLLGVVKIEGSPSDFIARYRDIVTFEKGTGVLQIGRFSDPSKVEDLAALTLDSEDAEDLKKCRPGACEIKLSAAAMDSFRRLDWKAENASQEAEELARRMLVDFLEAYRKGGNDALGTLHDKKKPLLVRKQFEEMIQKPDLIAYFPSLYSFLNDYPAASIPGSEEFFYWSKVAFGLKPVVRINHVVIYEPENRDRVKYAVASKMLYTTHYFNTGIELKFLVVEPESPGAYYLVVSNQSRSDGLTGFTGSIVGGKIRGKAREGLEHYLAAVKRSLES